MDNTYLPYLSANMVNSLSLQQFCNNKGIGVHYPKFTIIDWPNNITEVICRISGTAETKKSGHDVCVLKEECAMKMLEQLQQDFDAMVKQFTPETEPTHYLRTDDKVN